MHNASLSTFEIISKRKWKMVCRGQFVRRVLAVEAEEGGIVCTA